MPACLACGSEGVPEVRETQRQLVGVLVLATSSRTERRATDLYSAYCIIPSFLPGDCLAFD